MEENSRQETDQVSEDEAKLRREIEDSERVLDGLEDELQAVHGELARHTQKEHQYDILRRVCNAIDELETAGAADLFWGQLIDRPSEHMTYARRNLGAYTEELERIEAKRQAIVDKIGDQNESLDSLDYDLRNAMEREESRLAEWVVEREFEPGPYRQQIMPWARGCEEDRFSRKSLLASVMVSLLVAVLIRFVDIPVPERAELIEVPERVAKLIREVRTPPPPPAPEPEPIEPEPEEPEPQVVEELPDEPTETAEQPVVAEAPVEDTREKVKSKGILAFRDSFANRAMSRPVAQLGSQARITTAGQNAVGRPERSMVTSSAPGTSGGINLSDISRQVGGGGQAIEGVALTRVASSIGGGEGPDRPLAAGASAGRTDEEIQIVFDRYKAALYRLYNRELRKDPTLRGQLILKLTIEPDGSVSFCTLQSSDMDAPTLAEQVVERVRNFDFGAKEDIVAMTIIYPIDFLPAA